MFSAERASWLKERKRIARCSPGVRGLTPWTNTRPDCAGVLGGREADADAGTRDEVEEDDVVDVVREKPEGELRHPDRFAPRSVPCLSVKQARPLVDGVDDLQATLRPAMAAGLDACWPGCAWCVAIVIAGS